MALGIALTIIIISIVALVIDSVGGGQHPVYRADHTDDVEPQWSRRDVMTELKLLRASPTAARPRASRTAALVLAALGIVLMVGGLTTLSMADDPWTGMIQFLGVLYVAAPGALMVIGAFLLWKRVNRMAARRRILERYADERDWS